jgi:DNA-binding transcriptional LysR family regulator
LAQRFASRHPDVTLVTQEMWNADMPGALRSATIDLAISLCPERAGELEYELIRRERVVALLPEDHPLSGAGRIVLHDLADEPFVMFPRELAPRLHDALLAICRVALETPDAGLDTYRVWHRHTASPAGARFRSLAATAFADEARV